MEIEIESKNVGTTVWTSPLVAIIYANLFEAKPSNYEGGKPSYRATILIPKDDKDTLTFLKKACETAQGGGSKYSILKDGDERTNKEGEKDTRFAGMWYLEARSTYRPIVSEVTEEGVSEITNKDAIRNLDMGQVVLNIYAYDYQDRKGIAANILGFCKVGSRHEGRTPAPSGDLFADIQQSVTQAKAKSTPW